MAARLGDGLAVALVAIPDHVVRCLIPGEGICDLTGDSLRCRMVSDVSEIRRRRSCRRMTKTNSSRKLTVGTTKEVHRADACRMVVQKGLPGLRPPSPTPRHVLGDRRLGGLDAELEEFAMYARCAPQPVRQAHLPDQTADPPEVSSADRPEYATSSANTGGSPSDATG